MAIRTLVTCLLIAGLLVPAADAVLCREADGRVEVEAAIGGLCADHMVTDWRELSGIADGCASCSDILLPETGGTLSKTRDADPQVPVQRLALGVSVRASAQFCGVCRAPTPQRPPQQDQITSVVLLR